jgi:hypothetical protein
MNLEIRQRQRNKLWKWEQKLGPFLSQSLLNQHVLIVHMHKILIPKLGKKFHPHKSAFSTATIHCIYVLCGQYIAAFIHFPSLYIYHRWASPFSPFSRLQKITSVCFFVNKRTKNIKFHVHHDHTVNRSRKIAWAFVARFIFYFFPRT